MKKWNGVYFEKKETEKKEITMNKNKMGITTMRYRINNSFNT